MKDLESSLQDFLEKRDARIQDLEEQVERLEGQIKNEDAWSWRELKHFTPEDNTIGGVELPIPRLEIRWRRLDEWNSVADYGLVYQHFMDGIIFVPMGSTKRGGTRVLDHDEPPDTPFRENCHIRCDMFTLNLPGFVTNGRSFVELSLKSRNDLPTKLIRMMEQK